MGGQNDYLKSGGFSQYLYTHGDVIKSGNLEAKAIYKVGTADYHNGLPLYSNTADMYFRLTKAKASDEFKIDQLRLYKDRKALMDFDWGHDHPRYKDGKRIDPYPKGTVHVQFYKLVDGEPVRDPSRTRMMSNAEIKKYGAFLRKADPTVKFR